MKKKSILLLPLLLFCCCGVFAAQTPMETFDRLRSMAIKKDAISMISMAEGDLLNKLLNGEIPKDFRDMLFHATDVFEDAYVRMQDPNKAEVYVFYRLEKKSGFVCLKMKNDGAGNFKVTSYVLQQPPGAGVYLNRFFKALKAKRTDELKEYLSAELFDRYQKGGMPGFAVDAPYSIVPGKKGSDKVDFSVTRRGLNGKITLKKSGMVWKISAVDEILCGVQPIDVVEKLCAYSTVFVKHQRAWVLYVFSRYITTLKQSESGVQGASAAVKFIQETLSFPRNEEALKEVLPDNTDIKKFLKFTGNRYRKVTPVAIESESENAAVIYVLAEHPTDIENICLYAVQVQKNNESWKINTEWNEKKVVKVITLKDIENTLDEKEMEGIIDKDAAFRGVYEQKISEYMSKMDRDDVIAAAASIYDITGQKMSGGKIEVTVKLDGAYGGELIFELIFDREKGRPIITGINADKSYKMEHAPLNVVKQLHCNVFEAGKKGDDEETEKLLSADYKDTFFEDIGKSGEFTYEEKSIQMKSSESDSAEVEVKYLLKAKNADAQSEDITANYTFVLENRRWVICDVERKVIKRKPAAPAAEGDGGESSSAEEDNSAEEDSGDKEKSGDEEE